ncbi:MAG TPA: HEAT repeat domain-containing protein [Pseudomonadota bacterium]|nr:HEAT repeat domain-containing protein [Pseudomonadota bacterium]
MTPQRQAPGTAFTDLKPENVMLVSDPVRAGEVRVKVLDFGIAKVSQKEKARAEAEAKDEGKAEEGAKATRRRGARTDAGAHLGTPLYMAPEQHGHAEDVDGKADVFSFGLVLYELLSGKLPYEKNSMALIAEPATPVHKVRKDVPQELSDLISRMLEFDGAKRPTMAQAAAQLEAFVKKSRRRISPLLTAIGGAGFVVLSAAVGFLVWQWVHVPTLAEARERALKVIRTGLASKDAAERTLALSAIELSHDPNQAELLPPLLSDEQPVVQGAAAKTAGEVGAVELQPDLLSTLEKSNNKKTQMEVAAALAKLSHPKGTQTLRELLKQNDELVQLETAVRLAEQGEPAALAVLRHAVAQKPQPGMIPLLLSLAKNGDGEAKAKLRALWDGGQVPAAERTRIAFELARLGDADLRGHLEKTAASEGPEQVKASRYLLLLGDLGGAKLLEQQSTDGKQSDAVREVAVEGVADCGRPEMASRLSPILGERNIGRRLKYKTAGAILLLAAGNQTGTGTEDVSLRFAKAALGSQDEGTRELGLLWLSQEPGAGAFQAMKQALSDQSARVRKQAVMALSEQTSQEALSALVSALGDADKEVRIAAAQAVGRVGAKLQSRGEGEAAKPALVALASALDSGDERERAAKRAAMQKLGDKTQATRLAEIASSGDAKVRRYAVEHGDLGDEALQKALEDPDAKVRFAAAKKLAERGNKAGVKVLRDVAASSDVDAVTAHGLLAQLAEETEPPPASVLLGASEAERHGLLSVVETLPAKSAKKLLLGLAKDPSAAVRHRAAKAAHGLYVRTQDAAFLPVLRSLSMDTDPRVRKTARRLLEDLAKQNPQVYTAKGQPEPKEPVTPKSPSPPKDPGDSAPDPKDMAAPQEPKPPHKGSDPPPKHQQGGDKSGPGSVQFVGEEGLRIQIDKGAWQLLSAQPVPLPDGKHRVASVVGALDFEVKPGEVTTVKVPGSFLEQLLREATDALRNKDLARAQTLVEKAKRAASRTATRPQLLAELVFLQARLFDAKGQWREAMTEYQKYLSLPKSHQKGDTLAQVRAAVAKLAPRMGRVQIFTVVGGKCKLTDERFLPPGEHIVSLGGGKSKTVSIYAGSTNAIRQCP